LGVAQPLRYTNYGSKKGSDEMESRTLKKLVIAALFTVSMASLAACYYPDRDNYYYRDYAYRRDYGPNRYYYHDREWRDGYWGGEPHYRRGDRVYHED
jgi:hypothetical protein